MRAEPIGVLRTWDFRWAEASVPTALAIYWGEDLWGRVRADAERDGLPVDDYMAGRATARQRLEALAAAVDQLQRDFGTWKTPWGEINRFQRLTADIVQPFSDAAPSLPVGFTAGRWGSLAAFGARSFNGSKKLYGDRVRAKAVTAGGQSSDPRSPHFDDQAGHYAQGRLRDVHFHRDQLEGHIRRRYQPGPEAPGR
jgi:acyl-homoserine-lactone acylase